MMDSRWEFIARTGLGAEKALVLAPLDACSLSDWIISKLKQVGKTRREVVRASRLNQTFAYQIIAGQRNASRDKLTQLAFGMALGLDDANELLERGGVSALRPWCRRDVIIAYALERGLSLAECDDLLWADGESTITRYGRGGVFDKACSA